LSTEEKQAYKNVGVYAAIIFLIGTCLATFFSIYPGGYDSELDFGSETFTITQYGFSEVAQVELGETGEFPMAYSMDNQIRSLKNVWNLPLFVLSFTIAMLISLSRKKSRDALNARKYQRMYYFFGGIWLVLGGLISFEFWESLQATRQGIDELIQFFS